MMKSKLFDYVERDNFIYNLSGVTKLLGFLFLTFGSMYAYDIRIGVIIMIFSFAVLHWAEIKFSQIKVMMYYVAAFLVLNFILTFVFSPQYAVELYGTKHEIFAIAGNYVVTWEQLLYQLTKTVKYAAVVPLGMLFLLTTSLTQFMSNTACAALLAPIGLHIASNLSINPKSVLIVISVAASCALATPMGTPPNTLVMKPGGYRFNDYLRVGLPLLVHCYLTTLVLVPVFWRLYT